MSLKKETNSFIFEGEKIKFDFFDEENEEDKIEMKKLKNILSNSENNIEQEEDDNKDLNNITSVSDTDKVYVGEVKDGTKKSQESEYEIEDELNETSLTNKKCDEEPKELEEIINNKNNNETIKNEELNKNAKINLNNQNKILNNIKQDEDFMLNKNNNEKNNNNNKNKNKNKNRIFIIKKIKLRSKKIQLLRKKKGLHIIRKKDSDTIRKKIKTYFHNYILDLLNSKIKKLNIEKRINEHEQIISKEKINYKKVKKFLKFNNKFTTNVSINNNRNLLSKKLSYILKNEPISSKYKAYDLKNNYYLTNYLLSLKIDSDIHRVLDLTYMELFNAFIKSINFKNILKKIKNKDGEIYMNKFKYESNNYISYFKNTRAKKISRIEYNKKIHYKDKIKDRNKPKNTKSILINNLNNESLNYIYKDMNEMPIISQVNSNISLIEDCYDFFDISLNQKYLEEKSFNEPQIKTINIHEKNNKYLKSINEKNYEKKYEDKDIYSFENIFYNENEDCFWDENKNKNKILFNNNLSNINDDELLQEKNQIYINDDFNTIIKKATRDSSKTFEFENISTKFIEIQDNNDFNNKNNVEIFKEFL